MRAGNTYIYIYIYIYLFLFFYNAGRAIFKREILMTSHYYNTFR
ncbi:MAG: hypothetical protein N7Q72_02355 [Spiroplasma sp. Tabriz.8]|nr:hypothetical protein [Spiroplasma sp. Tabriz.8]